MNVRSLEQLSPQRVRPTSRTVAVFAGLLLAVSGCAAFHPLSRVPAAYLPDEYHGPSRSGKKTIDLSLLVQRPPDQYRLAAGDILSVYIPGVLGSLQVAPTGAIGETPPINLPQSPDDPPTIGFPTAVRDDGTISLPLVPPINVQGMTLAEAEHAVRQEYTVRANILNDHRERVLISLARRREYRVLVVRQETTNELSAGIQPGMLNIGNSKKGTAKIVRLPAYENDVLHALAKADGGSDGLPGLDAKNTIYIVRRKRLDGGLGTLPVPEFSAPLREQSIAPPPLPPWTSTPGPPAPSFVTPEQYPLP
ncbi:MAG: polysaccharide biosynthesis/export family protein, partial [Planctomycetaceae bacterium]|nr:polysaccharide biosynthesis/export family protein [Planctomycetaceae bacterium]